MPIVDGLTSTKMIRSFEKTHPSHALSVRAALNGRIPIIAVSASLEEKSRNMYIDGGFDGWILKPIPFKRLAEIMKGIVDTPTRNTNLYVSGKWEAGGWFAARTSGAETAPSDQPPVGAPTDHAPSEGLRNAVAADDPAVKEDEDRRQGAEQKAKRPSMPGPTGTSRGPRAEESKKASGEQSVFPTPVTHSVEPGAKP